MGDHRVRKQRSRARLSLTAGLILAASAVAGITTQANASSLSFQLDPGDSLGPGDKIVSASGLYRLEMLEDGRLVEYGPGEEQMFSMPSGIEGSILAMQKDGNLVLRAPGNIPTWSSKTDGNPGTVLQIQDDAGVMLYAPGHKFLKEILSPNTASSVPTPRLEPKPPVEFRVMSYNVRGNHHRRFEPGGPSDYSDVIVASNASIVGLQEISEEEASTVVEKLGWATGCDASHCFWTNENSNGEGTAILSRYPMRDTQTWTLPQTQKGDHDRLLTRAKVDVDGQTVHFYNTHLASKEGQDGQARKIEEIIEQDRAAEPDIFRPVLVGDMNAKPWDAAARTLADGMTDAWADKNPGASEEAQCAIADDKEESAPAKCGLTNEVREMKLVIARPERELPVRRIDYVFFGPATDYQVSDALVPDLDAQVPKKDGSDSTQKYWEISDHLPIVATLRF